MVTKIKLFESPDLTTLYFCLWRWTKSKVHKIKVDRRDELLAYILDAAGRIKKHEDQLKRTTHDFHTRVSKCIEVYGGIFEHLL
jgi:hypothetical protein